MSASLFSGLLAGGAAAQDTSSKPLWEAGIGVAALTLPHYRGSDQSNAWLLPLPYFVYRGEFLRADRSGARALLFNGERVEIDLSLAASAPADSGDSGARQGMPDLEPSAEIGPKLNATLARGSNWKLDLRVPLRAVVGFDGSPRRLGWTVAPVLNLDQQFPGGLNLGLQAGPLWSDRRLHAHYYSVAPAYARADRPAYEAPGGFSGWQAALAISRRSGPLWVGGFVRADGVSGAAFEASPLVRQRHGVSAGLAMSWVFATSEQRVPSDD